MVFLARAPPRVMLRLPVDIASLLQQHTRSTRHISTKVVRGQLRDDPGIHIWQDACRKVPHARILPTGSGGNSNQRFQGFLGDKLLGAAAAHVVEETIVSLRDNSSNNSNTRNSSHNELSVDAGCASALCNIALSNRFLHAYADLLLPTQCLELTQHMGDHGVGTMVEAAVAAVYEFDQEAVNDLARCLLTIAASIWTGDNPKGTY